MLVLLKDKYVHAMEYLHRHPDEIRTAWLHGYQPRSHPGATLFQAAGDSKCGCLTLVRAGFRAATADLTADIRADERVPRSSRDITPDNLNVFAEWQRRLDAELGEDRKGHN